jgi:hypothetical protein
VDVLLLAGDAEIDSLPEEKQVQFQEMRCAATGRGSMYDSVAGEEKLKSVCSLSATVLQSLSSAAQVSCVGQQAPAPWHAVLVLVRCIPKGLCI